MGFVRCNSKKVMFGENSSNGRKEKKKRERSLNYDQ